MQQQEIVIDPLKKTEKFNSVILSSNGFLVCLTWEKGLPW